MHASALHTVLPALVAVTTLIGMAACGDPASSADALYRFTVVGSGANVVPQPAPGADRLCAAAATITANSDSTITYSYTVTTPPDGTIDSVAIYSLATGAALPPPPATASVVLCATAAGCTGSGTSAKVATGYAALRTSMRGYGTQLVIFTTTRQFGVGGAIRGVIYPTP